MRHPLRADRYIAGPNETGLDAIVVSETTPVDWTVVTLDLWKDLGNCTITGLSLVASAGEEVLFDTFLLSRAESDFDAWTPGHDLRAFQSTVSEESFGTAFEDPQNPIRKLFRGERLDLWSLQAVTPLVEVAPYEAIDAYLNRELEQAEIKPNEEADRRTLIRRLTFDLTGLPPTPKEVASFVEDDSPEAYEQLVDRLLNSPAYGERQARLWLDVVRYADTNGYERDEFRPLIWKYRDYVVRAFNEDKPFDQFIQEQLAGDELVTGTPRNEAEAEALVATGFLRLGQWDSTAPIFQEEDRLRAEMQADLTNTTASAFLGLTMSCCQCHDHKYDPLSQADHYRLRAFFAGVEAKDDLVIATTNELAKLNEDNAPIEAEIKPLQTELDGLDKEKAENKPRIDELTNQINAFKGKLKHPEVAMGANDVEKSIPTTYVFYQGSHADPREAVQPGFPSVLYPGPAEVDAPREKTSGRRLTLARWIASAENPWTSRVLVNRIWQQHFGTGLVETANDFGQIGARPTHPELLDHLASSFVEQGWSIKKLHRALVMSAAYRRTSLENEQATAIDPDNRLLWRQNVRRLDAETIRDSLLAVSGLLNNNQGGKPVWPEVPQELLHAQPAILEAIEGKDGGRQQGWFVDPLEATNIRSLYLIRKRCLPIPFLQAFDLPDTTVSCARRDSTVVAPQAIMLLNSPSAIRYAEAFASKIEQQQFEQPEAQIQQLFQLALARYADKAEIALALELLQSHTELHQSQGRAEQANHLALVDLCRALFNLNEFIYID
ncbi:MAG: DUF1553 domain-containing protein [Planctomycetaceae bacterium]